MVIAWALIAIVMNVLDTITTDIAFKQYPDPTLKAETNPLMRKLMLKSPLLANVFKYALLMALIIIYRNEIKAIQLMAVMLCLVVLNNSIVILTRSLFHKKVRSPVRILQDTLHLPNAVIYPVVCLIIVGISTIIVYGIN